MTRATGWVLPNSEQLWGRPEAFSRGVPARHMVQLLP